MHLGGRWPYPHTMWRPSTSAPNHADGQRIQPFVRNKNGVRGPRMESLAAVAREDNFARVEAPRITKPGNARTARTIHHTGL